MRIFILTIDEPFFLPDFFKKIIEEHLSDIVGIGITAPFPRKLWIKHIFKQFQLHGFFDFLIYFYNYAIAKFSDFIGFRYKNRSYFSVIKLAKNYNISIYKIGNPNDSNFLGTLRTLDLDVIICQVSHVLSKQLLAIPKKGCINRHSSLLPKYRGLHPVFWAMLNGEKETGVTIHLMDESIDRGPIICQEAVKIYDDDTCYKIYQRTFDIGAKLALEALRKLEEGEGQEKFLRNWQNEYHSFPTGEAIRKFRKMGKRFGSPLI